MLVLTGFDVEVLFLFFIKLRNADLHLKLLILSVVVVFFNIFFLDFKLGCRLVCVQ